MRTLLLTKGYEALVDDEDYPDVSRYKWTALDTGTGRVYAFRNSKGKTIYLHRYIMKPEAGLVVDHRNHNGLDNRRRNLRVTTQRNNHFNSRAKANAVSKHKGVAWCNYSDKWRVTIVDPNGKRLCGGFFDDELAAAEAYKNMALKLHGEFACVKQARA